MSRIVLEIISLKNEQVYKLTNLQVCVQVNKGVLAPKKHIENIQ